MEEQKIREEEYMQSGQRRESDQKEQQGEQRRENEQKSQKEQQSQSEQKKKEEQTKQAYAEYVKQVTPKNNLAIQMVKAFVVGGIICVIGQVILNVAKNKYGLDKDTAGSWCAMLLVLASAILTGLNLYQKLVKFGGAGALVPITGFANSVASTAIEYQKEGQVYGIGCKIFTIAGPVILYGIFTSWVLGVIYWIGKMFGIC